MTQREIVTALRSLAADSPDFVPELRAGTLTGLRNVERRRLSDGEPVLAHGYAAAGDHQGVRYFWDPAETDVDNAGTVLQLSDGGEGRLVMAGYDAYDPRWFGVVGDSDGTPGNGTNDTVAVQRWFDQVGDGATYQFPAKRKYDLPFAARLTDTVVFKSVNGRLQGQGYSRSSTNTRNLYCDFDDPSKGLLEINKRSVLSGLMLDIGGNRTTGITDSGAGQEACYIDRCGIVDCGGHGILNLNNVGWRVFASLLSGGSVSDIKSMVEPVTGTASRRGGSIGIYGKSDIIVELTEIAAGFHYGMLLGGTQVAALNNWIEQCRIGLLFAGNTGRVLGNRFAFNWLVGLMIGTGHLTQIAGLDMSGFIPKILNLGGNQYHNNGRDRVNNAYHNPAGRALHINNRTTFRGKLFTEGEIIVGEESFNGYDGADSFYTEFGVVVSGGGLREAHFSGGKIGHLNSSEVAGVGAEKGFGSGGALMYANASNAWSSSTSYSLGDLVHKTIDSIAHAFRCMVPGTSGSVGPVGTDYDHEYEGANLFDGADDFTHASWGPANTTVTADQAQAPAGGNTADRIQHTTSSAAISQTKSVSGNGVRVTCLMFLKSDDGHQWNRFTLSASGGNINIWFDITNGQVGTVTPSGEASVADAGCRLRSDGWALCWVSGVVSTSASSITFSLTNATGNGSATEATATSVFAADARLYDDTSVMWAHLGQDINDADSHMEFDGVSFDDVDGLLQCERRVVEGGVEVQRRIAHTDGGVNTQTGTAYTLVREDADSGGGKSVVMNNGSANTLTIPPQSSVPFLIGDYFSTFCQGAGTTTVTAGAGVTLLGTATVAQNESAVWRQIAADTWARISS